MHSEGTTYNFWMSNLVVRKLTTSIKVLTNPTVHDLLWSHDRYIPLLYISQVSSKTPPLKSNLDQFRRAHIFTLRFQILILYPHIGSKLVLFGANTTFASLEVPRAVLLEIQIWQAMLCDWTWK